MAGTVPAGVSHARPDPGWLAAGALCAAPPVAETIVLWLTGLQADRALATQVTAPSPWGEYHDLRWLLVFHDSWLMLGLQAAALVALRTVLDGLIVRACWPAGTGRNSCPEWGPLLRRLAVAVPVIWLLLLPWTVLGFGMDVVSISWLFFTAVPPVLVVALACSPTPAVPRWWCRVPPGRALSTVLVVFLGQSVASAAILSAPAALWLPVAAAAGLGNAWAWRRLVRIFAEQEAPRRPMPVAPAVSIGMLLIAICGAAISFAIVGARRPPAGAGSPTASAGGPPVLVISGFDSKIDGETPPPPVEGRAVRYSYRGLDQRGRPEPYQAADTHQSIPALVRLLSAQVDALHASSGQAVSIVAESEGSLLTEVYLAADPGAPVVRAILLSPLDQPARVYYPPAGRSGYGVATGAALASLTSALGGISPVHLPADAPLLRSIVDHASSLRGLLSCPSPIPEDILEPLADSLADPVPPAAGIPTVVVPAFHGGLLTNAQAQGDVDRLLAGRSVRSGSVATAAETLLRRAAAGWQVPSLPLSLYAGSSDRPSCPAMTAALRRWVGPISGKIPGR